MLNEGYGAGLTQQEIDELYCFIQTEVRRFWANKVKKVINRIDNHPYGCGGTSEVQRMSECDFRQWYLNEWKDITQ